MFFSFECQTRDGKVQNSNQLKQLLSKYNGKRIVIIDDINDTGTTLQGIHDIVIEADMDKNVKYVTLLEKQSSDFEVHIMAKYLGEEEENNWIVFPYEEWWNGKCS